MIIKVVLDLNFDVTCSNLPIELREETADGLVNGQLGAYGVIIQQDGLERGMTWDVVTVSGQEGTYEDVSHIRDPYLREMALKLINES